MIEKKNSLDTECFTTGGPKLSFSVKWSRKKKFKVQKISSKYQEFLPFYLHLLPRNLLSKSNY